MAPQHKSPIIQGIIDPCGIPSQMNNMCVLIVTHVTLTIHNDTQCHDPTNEPFLHFVWCGSCITCFSTLIFTIFYMLGLIDLCCNKIMPCGEVCLTIQGLVVFGVGVGYHCVVAVYGVGQVVWGRRSQCVELEMFKRIVSLMYFVWFLVMFGYLFGSCYKERLRTRLGGLKNSLVEL